MSRSTTALKRLGVPGLAAVTLVAGLPLFLGTAAAAPIGTLSITPVENGTAAAGSCQAYIVEGAPATANTSTVGETVNVILTNTAGTAASDAAFCALPTGGVTPAAGSSISAAGPQAAAGGVDQSEFTLTANGTSTTGRVVIGITRNEIGNVGVQAYSDTNNNNTFNAGEPTTSSTAVFTTGGPAGSNANQDAAEVVEVIPASAAATATVTADADTDNAIEGEARTYRVAVLNGANDRLAGATVSFSVAGSIAAANQGPSTFGVTDNNGLVSGTITFPERTGAGPFTDTVTFFVNQTSGTAAGREASEPFDTVAVTVRDNAAQQGRTVTVTPQADGDRPLNQTNPAVNEARDGNRTFRAVVDSADTAVTTTVGTELAFRVTGGSGDETVTPVESPTTTNNTDTADTNDSFVDFVVNDPTPTVGQTLTVTATIRGTSAAGTSTLTFRNTPADARSVVLTPETATAAPNTAQQLTATVRDVDGNTVQGVFVLFTETGAGAFRNGSSEVFGTTNAQGVATVETISLPGETGTQTVTADIRTATTGQANQASQPANTGTDPQGNALNATTNTGAAGVGTDTSTITFGTASPTPSQPVTPSPGTGTPGPEVCNTVPTVTLNPSTIIATGSAGVTVNAPANSQIQLLAYSQPSTTYRVVREATIDASGTPAQFRVVPPTNTRLYAQIVGCPATNPTTASVVLNVRTQLSLNVVRNGVQNYTFSGSAIPARPRGLIVSLYRVTDDGRQILTAQTRANANVGQPGYDASRPAGSYTINRTFTGTGRFGFVVRTGQDLQNAPGSSNVRSLLIF